MAFDNLLDQRVELQRPRQLDDGSGSYTDDEDDGFIVDYTDVSVKISDLSYKEEVASGQLQTGITHIMSMRDLPVTRQHRVIDQNGDVYEIMSVIPVLKPVHHLKVYLKLEERGEGVIYAD